MHGVNMRVSYVVRPTPINSKPNYQSKSSIMLASYYTSADIMANVFTFT